MKVVLNKELRIWGDPNRYTPNGKKPSVETIKRAFKKNPGNIKSSVENWENIIFPKKQKKLEDGK